ncbi:MAG TPA: hypothetical protein VL068_11610 [Microthrixaceae bacterium]|nr:hypothetical protein [Microthrixaceae bacterium]
MTESNETSGPTGLPPLEEQIRIVVDRVVDGGGNPVTADEVMNRSGQQRSVVTGEPSDPNSHGGRGSGTEPEARRSRWMIAAAALIIVIGAATAAYFLTGGSESSRVATTPGHGQGFESWGSGWHEIDRGPVPKMAVSSLAWFRGRLIVVGGSAVLDSNGKATWNGEAWAYDPAKRSWSKIPTPHIAGALLVVAGDRLVAVGAAPEAVAKPGPTSSRNQWAIWDGGASEWVDRGSMPPNPEAERLGVARNLRGGPELLVWTGKAVVDFTEGKILDPVTGEVGNIEFPKGVLTYGHLSGTYPVWTGSEIVWPSPGITDDAPGLMWGPDGKDVSEIPAPPQDQYPDSAANTSQRLMVAAQDGAVILIGLDGTAEPYVQRFDLATSKWNPMGGPERLSAPACFDGAANSGGDLLLVPCVRDEASVVPMVLRGGKWFNTDPLPARLPIHSGSLNLKLAQAGSSVVVWSIPGGEPDASDSPWAAVWVPEPTSELSPAQRGTPTSEAATTTIVGGD